MHRGYACLWTKVCLAKNSSQKREQFSTLMKQDFSITEKTAGEAPAVFV
jgi:hypothetical protein